MYKIELCKDHTIRILEMIENWCSGHEISKELGISRTAVWKSISKLKEAGYKIEAKKGKGYKLLKKPEISPYEIAFILSKNAADLVKEIYYFKKTDSTNERAKKIGKSNILVFAETQTSGRGRLGRRWVSEYGGIYFSLALKPNLPIDDVPKLTLTTGLAVCEALNELKVNAKIKWPNDILIGGKKVCGILCEIAGEVDSPMVIVGIGVNVKNKIPSDLKEMATSIVEHVDVNSSDVFERIIKKFGIYYKMLLENKWEGIRQRWIEKSDTVGKEVEVRIGERKYCGRATNLDKDGGLILNDRIKVYSGECFYI